MAQTILEVSDQVAWHQRQSSRGRRPPTFAPDRYRDRNVVGRCFNRLNQRRVLATCYAKRANLYRALAITACTLSWLRK